MNFSGMLKRYREAFPLQALNELLHEEEILDAEIGGCGAVFPSGLPFSQPGFSFSHMHAHLHCQDGLENCRIFSRVLITHVSRLAAKAPTIANASWLLRYFWGAQSRVQVFVLSVRLRTKIREYCPHWTCWTYCPSCSCRPVRIQKIIWAQKDRHSNAGQTPEMRKKVTIFAGMRDAIFLRATCSSNRHKINIPPNLKHIERTATEPRKNTNFLP